MVGAVGDAGVVDTLEARLEDARRRHEANEYGPNLPLAVIEAGICSVWVDEHPARPASPRPVDNEGGIDVGVNASGDQVGSNAGGTSRQGGVIYVDEVGGVQARGMRSSTATGSSQGDVGGRRASLSSMSATHVTAGGIAPSYGYFKFTPDRISITPLHVGRPDILTLKEAIEPQLEMAGLIGFARGTVATLEEHYPDLLGSHLPSLPLPLAPLPPSPALPCLPCVKGQQHAAPHSSSFPPTIAPLQTLHMDVWGTARVTRQGRERYFLLVVDNYTRYTTVFPLRSKGQVVDVLIPWICTVRLQLRERFGLDLLVLRLHSGRGGELSSDLLRDFCRGEGILHSFTLPDSPQQNGIAERRIGLLMEVARTSMIHAAAPHFLWPFPVWYAAHQLQLWPRVSLPETSPTLRWTGKVGDASVFRVWGSRAFVRDMSADKLSARAIPCVFLGFVPDTPGWQFYHPTLHRVLPSQDVTFDKSVPFYHLFPYHSAPLPPPPHFLAPGLPTVDPLPPQGPAPSGVSQVDPPSGAMPGEVAVDSGAARGIASRGAEPGGAQPGGAEPGGAETGGAEHGGAETGGAEPVGAASGGVELGVAESEGAGSGGAKPGGEEPGGVEPASVEPGGVEPGGAESEGAESGGAEPQGAALFGGSTSASPRQSPQQQREWLVRRARLQSGVTRAGGARAAKAGGAGVPAGAGVPGGTVATGPGGARTWGTRAAGSGGVGGAGTGDPVRVTNENEYKYYETIGHKY
ncbi:unnamed protein product [Closterium sp. NIES-54]